MTRNYDWFQKNILRLKAKETHNNMVKVQIFGAMCGIVVLLVSAHFHLF